MTFSDDHLSNGAKGEEGNGKVEHLRLRAATDSYDFFFYHLNEEGEVSEICTRWLFYHITNHRSGRNVSSAGARTPKKISPLSASFHQSLRSSPLRDTIAKSPAERLEMDITAG